MTTQTLPSYIDPARVGPWGMFLEQLERVEPHLGPLAEWLDTLREQPVQVYTVGLGISANNGPRASLEHVARRVFGLPVSASNKFELGRVRQAWTGEVSTHPAERFGRWLVGGTLERLVSTSDVGLMMRLFAASGEVDDIAVLRALEKSGYKGIVGCEYNPRGGTLEGLSWMKQLS